MEGTTHQGELGAPWRALVGCALHSPPLQRLFGPLGVFWSRKKSPKSFVAIGLRLVLISCEVKNKQKQQLTLWHYINRLVPKMI